MTIDWTTAAAALDDRGYARLGTGLGPADCGALAGLYGDDARFRSRVDMGRHRFGEGEYKYFADPLPEVVARLRHALYPGLAEIANRWAERLRDEARFPATLDEFLSRCHAAGQAKPTPLLLRYEAGGYNCLHQDLYGDVVFPIQVVAMLSRPGVDFDGGEFLLVEQRPRAQSMGEAIPMAQGELVAFTTRHRPVQGTRGAYRASVRHGVSRVHRGVRMTLGIIFHDAR